MESQRAEERERGGCNSHFNEAQSLSPLLPWWLFILTRRKAPLSISDETSGREAASEEGGYLILNQYTAREYARLSSVYHADIELGWLNDCMICGVGQSLGFYTFTVPLIIPHIFKNKQYTIMPQQTEFFKLTSSIRPTLLVGRTCMAKLYFKIFNLDPKVSKDTICHTKLHKNILKITHKTSIFFHVM